MQNPFWCRFKSLWLTHLYPNLTMVKALKDLFITERATRHPHVYIYDYFPWILQTVHKEDDIPWYRYNKNIIVYQSIIVFRVGFKQFLYNNYMDYNNLTFIFIKIFGFDFIFGTG